MVDKGPCSCNGLIKLMRNMLMAYFLEILKYGMHVEAILANICICIYKVYRYMYHFILQIRIFKAYKMCVSQDTENVLANSKVLQTH